MSDGSPQFGILDSSAYQPRWRISRETIAHAVGWARGRGAAGPGTRSFANWDEDALTMAVEACRGLHKPEALERLVLASTSLPFADRSNAGVAREALRMDSTTRLSELGGSRRAGTTALAEALLSKTPQILCATDCVDTRPGSEGEPEVGHGAAALCLGRANDRQKVRAKLVSTGSISDDFIDRYRQADQRFDYRLEGRWIRDAGVRKQLAGLVSRVLADAGMTAANVDHFLAPLPGPVLKAVARDTGIAPSDLCAELEREIGNCGNAQPLILLHQCLLQAKTGEHILLVGMGQGFDVLLLEVTSETNVDDPAPEVSLEDNYTRYLGVRRLLDLDVGIRGERDNRSSQSAAYRRHETLHGLLAGRCGACGKLQFPREALCVHCHHEGEQEWVSLADLAGTVNSFTEDWLAFTARPPLIFGNIHFEDGANLLMEFTDFEAGTLKAGQQVRMAFRIKDFDDRRGFRRYFWKPAPGIPRHG